MEGSVGSAIASVIDLLWTACWANGLKIESVRENVYTSELISDIDLVRHEAKH